MTYDQLNIISKTFKQLYTKKMKTLQIDEEHARLMYPTATAEFKTLFEDTFGKDFFHQKITDRIKTFEDVRKAHGPISDNLAILLNYNGTDKEMLAAVALAKISMIRKVLNEGWTPNWSNSNESKYYPWFELSSGVGLSCRDYRYTRSATNVGSRLVFKTRELAEYAGKQFAGLYHDLMVL